MRKYFKGRKLCVVNGLDLLREMKVCQSWKLSGCCVIYSYLFPQELRVPKPSGAYEHTREEKKFSSGSSPELL